MESLKTCTGIGTWSSPAFLQKILFTFPSRDLEQPRKHTTSSQLFVKANPCGEIATMLHPSGEQKEQALHQAETMKTHKNVAPE